MSAAQDNNAKPAGADAAVAQGPGNRAPMRMPGERFMCRVSIENFGLSVEAAQEVTAWGGNLCWEELQVRCEYSGVVQKTRWVPLPLSFEQQKQKALNGGASDGNAVESASDADSSLCLDDEDDNKRHTAAAGNPANKPKVVKLDYSSFNDCSFEVEFTAGTEGAPPDSTTATCQVRRKKTHHMSLSVEAQNLNRTLSTTGGSAGDQKPTSANKEAINAAFQKGAAKFSAWARGAFTKKSNKKELEAKQRAELEEEALLRGTAQGAITTENHNADGTYKPVALPSIDFSEAFNAPEGRKRYHLLLKPEKSKLPHRGEGVPLLVAFTVVAHCEEQKPVAHNRSFHEMVLVMDQFALNASEAAETSTITRRGANSGETEEVVRKVVGYGYAFTTNTAHSDAPMATSKIVSLDVTRQADGHCTRVLDFAAQHRTHDEHQLRSEDYEQLPTTACIVSSDCLVANPERVGHRVLCVSRFKTSKEGLCKPSYKCQVTFTLTRQYDNGDIEPETCEGSIDLSAMLNQELFTSRDREVRFSFGEILYMRFRRFCFEKPEFYMAPLLLPFDYDNKGVVIRGPCGPVSSWTRRKAGQRPPAPAQPGNTAEAAAAAAGAAAPQGADTVYGSNEVGEAPVGNEGLDDTASTDSTPSIDPNNPFYKSSGGAEESLTKPSDPGLVNPFAAASGVAAQGTQDTQEMTFEFGGQGVGNDTTPVTTAQPDSATDDFFMDDWGASADPAPQAHDVSAAVDPMGANMFAGEDSHVAGDDQSNMFATESRPAFVLEPMPGAENTLDWSKWGQ